MRSIIYVLVAAISVLVAINGVAVAGSSCTASNETGITCSISCVDGQAAVCQNATGSANPNCYCSSSLLTKRFAGSSATPGPPAHCVVLTMGSGGHARLVNTCNECRTAMFSDFHDGVKQFSISRYGYIDLPFIDGQLVSDHPCP
jgi:hypothetical protein